MSVLQHAHQPGEDERQQGEDAGGKQTQRADWRAAEVMDEDEAQEQQHHHGQEGEDGAHAAGRERNLMAGVTAAVRLSGLGRNRPGLRV